MRRVGRGIQLPRLSIENLLPHLAILHCRFHTLQHALSNTPAVLTLTRDNNFSVGAIYEEFGRQLESWRQQYAGPPRREMIRICLLALERGDVVARRLAAMPVDNQVREIVRHALVWAWKDEEMHAVYIRGLILKLGSLRLRAMA